MAAVETQRKILSVTEVTRLIRQLLERELGHVWIEGELSNVRRPSSGHLYLTIKDENAQIKGVLFKGDQWGLGFQPRDGQRVRVFGQVSVYERSGEYQIVIRQIEESGKGSLQARFEALKEKLRAEGLFDAARKRPLPALPQHLGVVTSPTGAAIRDILNVLTRRFPNLHVVLWPVRVQGEGAAEEIAAAVDGFNRRGGMDVLIVGRGGGSLEDLWCFNEEAVARAVARSSVPVISAVGHEIDFTICDFVADVRAPTPSAAAEIVVGTKDAFAAQIDGLAARLGRSLRESAAAMRHRVQAAAGHYAFREPGNLLERHRQTVGGLVVRLRHELQRSHRAAQQRVDDAGLRLAHETAMRARGARAQVDRLRAQLAALSPLAVLDRGYSITRDARGRVVRSAAGPSRGDRLTTRVADGEFESEYIGARPRAATNGEASR